MSLKYRFFGLAYRKVMKPVFFMQDPELVHDRMTDMGRWLGSSRLTRRLVKAMFVYEHERLRQTVAGLNFVNPVGLSAGFDYDGKMTGVMPGVGFGFESIGTVTQSPYEGNSSPRLGRLPKSRSLLVNKGFKSEGLERVLGERIMMTSDDFCYGISVGATNSPKTVTSKAQKEDIVKSFVYLVGQSKSEKLAYYELNISCPNVAESGSLANVRDLDDVLGRIRKLKFKQPLFVKFQLEIDWKEARKLIKVMIKHEVAAVIMANLLKNRKSKYLNRDEVAELKGLKGNFSGKPTWELSNDLISRTYKEFGSKINIVGVGGVFSANDAYEKIKRGASLVQLITGMIYQGPQLIGEINEGLVRLLSEDGFESVSEAVGVYHR